MTSIKLPHKSVRYTTAMSFSMPVRSFVRLSVAWNAYLSGTGLTGPPVQ